MSAPALTGAGLAREATIALRSAGRRAGRSALRLGGSGVARLDARPRGRRVILLALPHVLPRWFDASVARGLEATFELRVGHPAGSEAEIFAISISGARCTVTPGPVRAPGASVSIAAPDAIRVAAGAVGWPELMSSGRLVLAGDPFLALRFPSLFRLPAGDPVVPSRSALPAREER